MCGTRYHIPEEKSEWSPIDTYFPMAIDRRRPGIPYGSYQYTREFGSIRARAPQGCNCCSLVKKIVEEYISLEDPGPGWSEFMSKPANGWTLQDAECAINKFNIMQRNIEYFTGLPNNTSDVLHYLYYTPDVSVRGYIPRPVFRIRSLSCISPFNSKSLANTKNPVTTSRN